MSDIEKENQDIIQELGMIKTGGDFESDIQYINIIGGIEGHSALPAESKSTKYEHLIPQLIAVEENHAEYNGRGCGSRTCAFRNDIYAVKTNGFTCARRGTQYRDTLGNGNGLFIYSRDRYDDSASDTDDRSCNNC